VSCCVIGSTTLPKHGAEVHSTSVAPAATCGVAHTVRTTALQQPSHAASTPCATRVVAAAASAVQWQQSCCGLGGRAPFLLVWPVVLHLERSSVRYGSSTQNQLGFNLPGVDHFGIACMKSVCAAQQLVPCWVVYCAAAAAA
jgi:hypothetical protein